MAHLRSLVDQCAWPRCTVRASVELYSWRNEPCGKYCKEHGRKALMDRSVAEERQAANSGGQS